MWIILSSVVHGLHILKSKGYEDRPFISSRSTARLIYRKRNDGESWEPLVKKFIITFGWRCNNQRFPLTQSIVQLEAVEALWLWQKTPADREGCDIGPKTLRLFADAVKTAKTVVMERTHSVFENPDTCSRYIIAVAKALRSRYRRYTNHRWWWFRAAVNQLGIRDKMTHISTGVVEPLNS